MGSGAAQHDILQMDRQKIADRTFVKAQPEKYHLPGCVLLHLSPFWKIHLGKDWKPYWIQAFRVYIGLGWVPTIGLQFDPIFGW